MRSKQQAKMPWERYTLTKAGFHWAAFFEWVLSRHSVGGAFTVQADGRRKR